MFLTQKIKNRPMKLTVNIARVIVGLLFIFSGLIKAIDPLGLKRFFEKIQKLEGGAGDKSSAFSQLGGIFSTHPGTEDRMKLIEPLPAGVIAKPSLTQEQWLALKDICK